MWIRFLRFLWPGPGKYLLGLGAVLGLCYLVGKAFPSSESRPQTASATRPLGKAYQGPNVDLSQVPHGETLSNRPLRGIPSDSPAPPSRPSVEASVLQKAALFVYEAPSSTPTPPPSAAGKESSQRRKDPQRWLPLGTPVRCELWGAAESSAGLEAPITGIVIEDAYQNCDGIRRLVIPYGTLVKCWASPGAVRNRLRVSGRWVLTFLDGKSLKVDGTALACQADPSGRYTGLENGTGGIIGHIVETDPAARLEALIPLFITSVLSAGNTAVGAVLQASHSSGFYQPPDTGPIVARYMDQLMDGKPDTQYVRVDAKTNFWLYASETIDPSTRTVFCDSRSEESPASEPFSNGPALDPAVQAELNAQMPASRAAYPPQLKGTPHETQPRMHFR